MLITSYKITSPEVIEETIECLDSETNVLVKLDTLAICKADIRYFLGAREKNVLDHKYPLTPIHEAVGIVVKDASNEYKKGDKVILVPNSINESKCASCLNKRCQREDLGNNYCPYAAFRSSTIDGFLKPFYSASKDILVKYNSSIPSDVAVWSELLSVSYAASRRVKIGKGQRIALFGDGIMGYMVYLILYHYYHADVTVFGVDENKMLMFKHAKTCKYEEYSGDKFDTLFECVGGRYSGDAINNMIALSLLGADLVLMCVSEDKIPINTRVILEKGLSIKGVTRSNKQDFEVVAKLLESKKLQEDIKPLILSSNVIHQVSDIYNAFKLDINNKTIIGKNLLKF